MLEGPKQWIQLDEGSNSAIGYPPWNGGAGLLLLGLEVERRAGVLTYILHLFASQLTFFAHLAPHQLLPPLLPTT